MIGDRIRDRICRKWGGLDALRNRALRARSAVRMFVLANYTRVRYGRLISKFGRGKLKGKFKVLFLLNESSKWKCHSLYEAMLRSGIFEPTVAITRADADWKLSKEEYRLKQIKTEVFCSSRGLCHVLAYDSDLDEAIDLRRFSPHIVIYSNPWKVAQCQQPQEVAKFALTCYIPYYVVCYDAPQMDSQQDFHRLLWRYFLPSGYWAGYFRECLEHRASAGEMVGIGHPMLDIFSDAGDLFCKDDLVIYAPHWSIPGTGCEDYSTFLETGGFILEYAIAHPEFKWCFKPHPTLRIALVEHGGWAQSEVDSYYKAWEKLGTACYDGNYPALFHKSRALITDCSSFLMEYSAVNRPLIHLVSSRCRFEPAPPSKALFESFYSVRSVSELKSILRLVLEENMDLNRSKRFAAIKELNIWHVNAASDICDYLVREISV